MDRWAVVFDEDCGLCRSATRELERWDAGGRLRFVGLRSPDAGRLLAGLSPAAREASWHVVSPSGHVRSGGEAVAPLLELLPAGTPLAALARALPGATDRAYRLVADHRGAIGRALGLNHCGVSRAGS